MIGGPTRREAQQCTRFHRDGQPCRNLTTAVDGWCRSDGCPGYVQPLPATDGVTPPRALRGTRRHVAETGRLPVGLDVDEVPQVRVTRAATAAFRSQHQGTDEGAEHQLRMMLEDFLVRGSRRIKHSGYIELAREGYELILSPDGGHLVGYRTVHRERTWEQVKAGVRSRYRGGRPSRPGESRRARGTPPPGGPALPPYEAIRSVDPGSVHLTGRVRTSYVRVRALAPLDDDQLDEALRSELAASLPHLVPGAGADAGAGADTGVGADTGAGAVAGAGDGAGDGGRVVLMVGPELTWLLSPDARSLVGVRRRRDGDRPGEH